MSLVKKWVLQFIVVLAAVAIIASRGPKFPSIQQPVNWRDVTVGGFKAGVTAQQLEARFGPPTALDNGVAVWFGKDGEGVITFRQDRDGSHLAGNRLLLDGRVIAKGGQFDLGYGFHNFEDFLTERVDGGSLQSQVEAQLGRGESITVPYEAHEAWEASEIEAGLRYRDNSTDHQLTVRIALWPRSSDPLVDQFDIVWRGPGSVDPVVHGYSPGQDYSIYPDGSGLLFSCSDLALSGKVIVPYQSERSDVRRILGNPALSESIDGEEWWGYWTPDKDMGILVHFDMGPRVSKIEVSRDWRILAEQLGRHKQEAGERSKQRPL